MMRGFSFVIPVALAGVFTMTAAGQQPATSSQSAGAAVTSLYDFKTKSLDGKPADLGAYKGKVSLVVNVASKCG